MENDNAASLTSLLTYERIYIPIFYFRLIYSLHVVIRQAYDVVPFHLHRK